MKLKTFTEHINESTSAQGLLRLIELGLAEPPVRIEYFINVSSLPEVWKILKTPVEIRDWNWLDEFRLTARAWPVTYWDMIEGSSPNPSIINDGRVYISQLIAENELKWFGPKICTQEEFVTEVGHRVRSHIIKIARDLKPVPVWITEIDSGILYSVETGQRLN
jgi:hypothetical protein